MQFLGIATQIHQCNRNVDYYVGDIGTRSAFILLSTEDLPRLEQIFGLISGLQPENVLLFGIIVCFGGQRMVDADGVVEIVADLILTEAVLVLMQIQYKISKRTVVHLPAALVKRS